MATFKLLKRFYKSSLDREQIADITGVPVDQDNHLRHLNPYMRELVSARYITERVVVESSDSFGEPVCRGGLFEITLSGKAYVESRFNDTIKFWIPIAISNLIACVALFRTFL